MTTLSVSVSAPDIDAPFSLTSLEQAANLVYQAFEPTPQYNWPLLSQRYGASVWVKHENMTPVGAFKVRGGLTYLADLLQKTPVKGLMGATRGNHGQSLAYAGARYGLPVTIVVPLGNSQDKNRAMVAQGAELIEYGDDFQESIEYAKELAVERGYHFVPSFHAGLVKGVASYSLEFLKARPNLDTVYVSIGLGSGICGMLAAREALGHSVKVVGVVSEGAPAYYLSHRYREPVSTETANTIADGIACRIPNPDALEMIMAGVDDIVCVSDDDILEAMAVYFSDTHHVAEGAGAAPLAGLIRQHRLNPDAVAGKEIGVILSGGNVDADLFQQALKRPTH